MYSYIIIDDEILTREGTKKKIDTLDGKVECIGEASNGLEGLKLLDELNPDIIITDMYMPVLDGSTFLVRARKKHPNTPIIVISGYKDFEYARQSISSNVLNYILKPFSKEDIRNAMEEAIKKIDNRKKTAEQMNDMRKEKEYIQYDYDIQLLKSHILGYQNDQVKLSSEKINFLLNTHNFVLFTISSDLPLDEEFLNNYAAENGYGDLGLYLSHLHDKNIGFFILFFPDKSPLQLSNTVNLISNQFIEGLSVFGSHLTIGISSMFDDVLQLHEAYKQTIEALNSSKITDSNKYYIYNNDMNHLQTILWTKLEELYFRIESGESDKVLDLVNDLYAYCLSSSDYTLYDIKYYISELIQNIKGILNNYFDSNIKSNSSSLQNIFNSIFSFEELKSYILQFLLNITNSMKGNNVYNIDDVIEKIKIYVQRNYSNNLSLEFIASLFYMNRSYISYLFKERTGEKFIDYVTHIRIEKAKQLLKTSDKKMYQISKMSGYDNVKYFFRIFKKEVGLSPEQYRIKGQTNHD